MKRFLKLTTAMCALVAGIAGLCSCEKTTGGGEVKTPENTLTAPTNPRVKDVTNYSVTLLWGSAGDGESYEIRIGGEQYETAETSYDVSNLDDATEYTWTVRAVKGEETSDWVEGMQFTTLAGSGADVPQPTNLRTTELFSTSVMLLWDPAPDTDGVQVEIIGGETANLTNGNGGVATGREFSGLTADTRYNWRMRSVASGRYSLWVDGPEFTTTQVKEWVYESLLGRYGANGKKLEGGSTAKWNGEVFQPEMNGTPITEGYGLTAAFNINADMYLNLVEGRLFLADDKPLLEGNAGNTRVVVYAVGFTLDENGEPEPVTSFSGRRIELTWNAAAKTLSFPAQSAGKDLVVGLYAYTANQNSEATGFYGWYSDAYQNLVLTLAGGGTRMMSGERVDVGKVAIDNIVSVR